MSEGVPSRSFARVAVALPILLIILAIVQAQWRRSQGLTWDLPLAAYDPRDILRGKYLSVRFALEIDEARCDGQACCVCHGEGDLYVDPARVEARSCQEASQLCKEWVEVDVLHSSFRYFIPEARSMELERKVMKGAQEKRARVRFVLDQNRRPQISGILIDGEPLN